MFDNTKKNTPRCLTHGKDCVFLPRSCVFNNPLGVTEKTLLLAQSLADDLVQPNKMLPEVGDAR